MSHCLEAKRHQLGPEKRICSQAMWAELRMGDGKLQGEYGHQMFPLPRI